MKALAILTTKTQGHDWTTEAEKAKIADLKILGKALTDFNRETLDEIFAKAMEIARVSFWERQRTKHRWRKPRTQKPRTSEDNMEDYDAPVYYDCCIGTFARKSDLSVHIANLVMSNENKTYLNIPSGSNFHSVLCYPCSIDSPPRQKN